MAKAATTILDGFQKKVASLDRSRKRAEGLYSIENLSLSDLERQYEALYINMVRSFETSVERLFLGLLAQTISSRFKSVRPIVTAKSIQSARRVVCGDRSYVDWLPYDHTKRRAKAFFSRGLPFVRMSSDARKKLLQVGLTRNAIAHDSVHARKMFRTEVVGGVPLLPRAQTPAGFLRSHYVLSPPETRFELFSAYLVQAGAEIMQ